MKNLDTFDLEDVGGDMVAFVDPRTKHIIECNEILADAIGDKKTLLIGRSIFEVHHESCRKAVEKVLNTFLRAKSVPDADLLLQKKRGGTIPVSLRLSGSEDEKGRIRCTRFSWHNISQQKMIQRSLIQERVRLKQDLGSRLADLQHTKEKVRREERRRKAAEAKIRKAVSLLRRQRNELRMLAGRLISVQEEERRRLARDLHDDTCQKLGMLAFQVEMLAQKPPKSPESIQKELQGLHPKITTLANDIRAVSHRLHPAVLDYLGLAKAIEAHIEDFAQRETLHTTFKHENIPKSLPPDITNCLYRITQECLGNSAKHGNASKVAVALRYFTKSLRLTIRDNGIGLTAKQVSSFKKGLGFISMQERLRLVKGRLTVKTKPKQGTEVIVHIPYTKNHS